MDTIFEQHRMVAGLALASCSVLGVFALAGFFLFRRKAVACWFAVIMLLAMMIVGVLQTWTAYLGGQIRHSEIRTTMRAAP